MNIEKFEKLEEQKDKVVIEIEKEEKKIYYCCYTKDQLIYFWDEFY